jgi:hypothetical protein
MPVRFLMGLFQFHFAHGYSCYRTAFAGARKARRVVTLTDVLIGKRDYAPRFARSSKGRHPQGDE